jgi:predicted transcriptional regulator
MATRPLSISLDAYSFDCLRAMADQEDRSLSYVIGEAIREYVKGNEYPDSGLLPDELEAINDKYGIGKKRGKK